MFGDWGWELRYAPIYGDCGMWFAREDRLGRWCRFDRGRLECGCVKAGLETRGGLRLGLWK